MPNDVLDYAREKDPRFKKVSDEDLTLFIGEKSPEFLKDEGFRAQYTALKGARLAKSFGDTINRIFTSPATAAASEAGQKQLGDLEQSTVETGLAAEQVAKGVQDQIDRIFKSPGAALASEQGREQIARDEFLNRKVMRQPIHPTETNADKLLGQFLSKGGTFAKDMLGAFVFHHLGQRELEQQQTAVAMGKIGAVSPDTGVKLEGEDLAATPMEEGIQKLPDAPRVAAEAGYGLAETSPRLALMYALHRGGLPAPAANALAFGETEHGFSPKDAAIAAVIPYVGKYSGEISTGLSRALGVTKPEALKILQATGAAGGASALIAADQAVQIMKLPEDQRGKAIEEAVSANVGNFVLGLSGIAGEAPGEATAKLKAVAKAVPKQLPSTILGWQRLKENLKNIWGPPSGLPRTPATPISSVPTLHAAAQQAQAVAPMTAAAVQAQAAATPEKPPTLPSDASGAEVAPVAPSIGETPQEGGKATAGEVKSPALGETQTVLSGTTPRSVPAAQIALRPDLMQFKRIDDALTGENAGEKLSVDWDELKAGLLLLWEPKDPQAHGLTGEQRYIVANGHHRAAFGTREGVGNFNAQVLREADGYSAEDARRTAAEINIADGKGTIYDQAKYLRNSGAARNPDEEMGARARVGAKGRQAATLAFDAADDLFASFVNERITPGQAESIAAAAPKNDSAQRIGIKFALEGKSADFLTGIVKRALQSTGGTATELDLFGSDDSALRSMEADETKAAEIRKGIRDQIQSVAGAAKKPDVAASLGVDVKDPEGVRKRIEQLRGELSRWEGEWWLQPDLMKQVRGEEAPTEAGTSADGKHFIVTQGSHEIHIFENAIAAESFKVEHAEKHGGRSELDERVGKSGETIQDVLNSASRVVGKGKSFKAVFHKEKPDGTILEVDLPKQTSPAPPTLRAMEQSGELFQSADQPFNLAGEQAVDTERVAKERAVSEQRAKEAADIAAKQQGELPGTGQKSSTKAQEILRQLEEKVLSAPRSPTKTLLYQQLGAEVVPRIRLGDAEEAGRLYELFQKGGATEAEWNKWVEEAKASGRVYPESFDDKDQIRRERIAAGIEPEHIQITVSPEQVDQGKPIPGTAYVQVDEIHPEKGNTFSSNPEQMNKDGFAMPSSADLLKLPAGKYTLTEFQGKNAEYRAKKEAAIQANLKSSGTDGVVEMTNATGDPDRTTERILITPSTSEPGKWQASRFYGNEAYGHQVFDSREAAIRAYSGESFTDMVSGPSYAHVGEFKVSRVIKGAESKPAPETITSAAYTTDEGKIETGPHHPGILDRLGIKGFESRESRNTPQFGYATSKRAFVTREEAAGIAKESGQQLEPFDVSPTTGTEQPHSDQIQAPGKPEGTPISEAKPALKVADGTRVRNYVKQKGRWYPVKKDGSISKLATNATVSKNLEAEGSRPPPPPETRTPQEILSQAAHVRVKAPAGATVLRVWDNKGRKSDQFLNEVNKGDNVFRGSDVERMEAGFINKKREFQKVEGDIQVTEYKPPPGPGTGEGPGTPGISQPPDPKAQIQQLEESLRNVEGKKVPLAQKVKDAFAVGQRISTAKDAVSSALSGLKTAGDYLIKKWAGYNTLDEMLRAKGELSAEIEKRGWRVRQFTKTVERAIPDKRQRAAIAKWVDAGGDMAELARGESETRDEYKQAYRDAQALTGDALVAARNIQNYFESRLDEAINAGVLQEGIEDYIHRIYEGHPKAANATLAYVQSGILKTNPALAKKRVFQFDWEAEKLGYKPVQDFLPRIAQYETSLARAIAARSFIRKVAGYKDAVTGKRVPGMAAPDGRPVLDVAGIGIPINDPLGNREATLIQPSFKPEDLNNPANNRTDYKERDYPALRKWRWATKDAGGNPIFVQGNLLIHKDFVGRIDALLKPSAVRYADNPRLRTAGNLALGVSSTVKQTMLDFSLFHQVQMAVHGMEHRVMPGTIVKEIDFENPHVDGLLKGGITLGGEYHTSHQGEGLVGRSLSRLIPIVNPLMETYHNYLFQDYIPRLKMTMALHALERNQNRPMIKKELASGKMTQDELYHLTANQANAAFGELNYTMLERSRTMRDVSRLLLLAPDFLEARGRFAIQALTKHGSEQRMALLLGATTMWVTARIMNKLLDDQYHLEPENLFSVVYKGRSFGLRTVQGDILHAIEHPLQFWMSRLNPVYGRTLLETATGRDYFGRKRSVPEQLWDAVSTAIPISLRSNRERQRWESIANAFGITARRWSDVDDAFKLAQKWKDAHKVGMKGEFIYDPNKDVLRPLKIALSQQDDVGAAKEIKKLIDSKDYSIKKLNAYFERYATMPFTGSRHNDTQFKAGLNEDQKKTVEVAAEHKKAINRLYKKARANFMSFGETNAPAPTEDTQDAPPAE